MGRFFRTGGMTKEIEQYWPGFFIQYNAKNHPQYPNQNTASILIRAGEVGQDIPGPTITRPGWWTMGMTITPDGKVHYYAHEGVANLTRRDHLYSNFPIYGYKCLQTSTYFFNIVNQDDGRTWSTRWIVDDPKVYVATRPYTPPAQVPAQPVSQTRPVPATPPAAPAPATTPPAITPPVQPVLPVQPIPPVPAVSPQVMVPAAKPAATLPAVSPSPLPLSTLPTPVAPAGQTPPVQTPAPAAPANQNSVPPALPTATPTSDVKQPIGALPALQSSATPIVPVINSRPMTLWPSRLPTPSPNTRTNAPLVSNTRVAPANPLLPPLLNVPMPITPIPVTPIRAGEPTVRPRQPAGDCCLNHPKVNRRP